MRLARKVICCVQKRKHLRKRVKKVQIMHFNPPTVSIELSMSHSQQIVSMRLSLFAKKKQLSSSVCFFLSHPDLRIYMTCAQNIRAYYKA